jgi:Cyclic nucleotide-binding domain
MNLLSVDVDFIGLRSTPLQMLVTATVLVIAVALIVRLVVPLLSGLIDRVWPATRAPSPTELLWGEMGGYVRKTFRGLDEAVAKDVATQIKEVTVPAGSFIIEQDDPPTHFYWLKAGEAEVRQRIEASGGTGGEERVIRRHQAGESFGEVAILKRMARTASVKALTDCVLLELPADEFVNALALSAADESQLFGNVERYLAEDRQRARGGGGPSGKPPGGDGQEGAS